MKREKKKTKRDPYFVPAKSRKAGPFKKKTKEKHKKVIDNDY